MALGWTAGPKIFFVAERRLGAHRWWLYYEWQINYLQALDLCVQPASYELGEWRCIVDSNIIAVIVTVKSDDIGVDP